MHLVGFTIEIEIPPQRSYTCITRLRKPKEDHRSLLLFVEGKHFSKRPSNIDGLVSFFTMRH